MGHRFTLTRAVEDSAKKALAFCSLKPVWSASGKRELHPSPKRTLMSLLGRGGQQHSALTYHGACLDHSKGKGSSCWSSCSSGREQDFSNLRAPRRGGRGRGRGEEASSGRNQGLPFAKRGLPVLQAPSHYLRVICSLLYPEVSLTVTLCAT